MNAILAQAAEAATQPPFSLAWVMITAAVVMVRQDPPAFMAGSLTRYLFVGVAAALALWLAAPLFSRKKPDADAGDDGADDADPNPETPPDDTADKVQV